MTIELFAAFILASAILALTPGPAMSLIVSNSVSHGTKAGVITVAGNSSGLTLLVVAAILGMSSIMALMADWFDLVRWVGAAYLIWLGASRIYRAYRAQIAQAAHPEQASSQVQANFPPAPQIAQKRYYWQGLFVSLSNPKVLLFLGAFFPQFVTNTAPLLPQFVLLAIAFLITITLLDLAMAYLAGSVRNWFSARRQNFMEYFSGMILLCGGAWLALARRG